MVMRYLLNKANLGLSEECHSKHLGNWTENTVMYGGGFVVTQCDL